MSFTRTTGHEKQKALFLQALQTGRLAHAYALVGEEGVGKTTFAIEFARLLGADSVLDVFILDAEEMIPVEEIRELRIKLSLAPAGKAKVAIIKGGNLTEEAANGLLKILEEPPKHSYIFLTVVNFYSLLPTIASRVQKVIFGGKREWDKQDFDMYYQALASDDTVLSLKTAETLANMENVEISDFLKFAMDRFCLTPDKAVVGIKLLTAFSDLQSNVNAKLALDNLFLPQ